MNYIVNGNVLYNGSFQTGLAIGFDSVIQEIIPVSDVPENSKVIDACGKYVLPGLIDIHIHGYRGNDVSDGDPDKILEIASDLVSNGVTSFLPTTMTIPMPDLEKALDAVRTAKKTQIKGSHILGAHAEGPFINPSKKGAQPEEAIRKPDGEWIARNSDIIRYITLAPEMDPSDISIQKAIDSGVVVSMGHTNATYEQAMHAVSAGVSSTTHLFNAMSPLNHREPGVVGAALSSEVYSELITDMHHVSASLFPMISSLKGDKLIAITDCLSAGGLPAGEYTLGGQTIIAGGPVCVLKNGTIAGSVLRLNKGVYNLYLHSRKDLAYCVACATEHPAKLLGIDDRKGRIAVGLDADILIADDQMEVLKVFVSGNEEYSA